MSKRDAEITVGCDATAVERAAAVTKAAWRDVGQSLASSVGGAAQTVVHDLAQVALAAGKVSFSSQHAQVREFEAATARFAVSAHADLGRVRAEAEATGTAIGKRPAEVVAWATSVKDLTYNADYAAKSMRGMAALAAETGRGVEAYQGLAVELGTVGKVAGDTTHVLGVMHAQADKVGTAGGIAAFADQIEGLTETISHFRTTSEADFARISGLAAELGKGLSPAASRRVQQTAIGSLAADPVGWSRYLGRDITDEHGQVKDPAKVLEQIVSKAKRTFGKDSKRVLMLNFGAETGAALANADFKRAAELSGLAPSGKSQQALAAFKATDAGKREVAEAELAKSSRELLGSSSALGRAADALQRFAANHPVASTFATTAAGMAAGTTMTKLGGSIAGMMGGKGKAGALGGLIELGSRGAGAGSWAMKGAGLAGVAGVAGLVAGAGALGYGAGYLIDEGFGVSDWISGIGGSSRAGAREAELDRDRDKALAVRLAAVRRTNAALRHTDGLSPEELTAGRNAAQAVVGRDASLAAGGSDSLAALVAELRRRGESQGEADKIARAIVEALRGVSIQVQNASDSPLSAVMSMSSSPAAGAQSG